MDKTQPSWLAIPPATTAPSHLLDVVDARNSLLLSSKLMEYIFMITYKIAAESSGRKEGNKTGVAQTKDGARVPHAHCCSAVLAGWRCAWPLYPAPIPPLY